jgi:hypothetical protein
MKMTTRSGRLTSSRLTDGEISDPSKDASLKDGDRSSKEGDHEPPINLRKILPDHLLYSLYRGQPRGTDNYSTSEDSTIRDLFSRLDANGSGFDDLSNLTNLNFEIDSINEKSMKDIIKNIDSLFSKREGVEQDHDKTLPLKAKDKGKAKDFNVNINLNLRVLNEGKRTKQSKPAPRPAFEEQRKTSDSLKLIQEIKDKFRKKTQPAQLAVRTQADQEYKTGASGRRLGASSKDIVLTTSKTAAVLKQGLGQTQKEASKDKQQKEGSLGAAPSKTSLKIKNFDMVGKLD